MLLSWTNMMGLLVLILLIFCIVLCPFVFLGFVSCTQCCLCFWIIYSWLPLLCSLTFPISIRWFIIGVTKILIVYLTSILHYPFLLQHSDDGRRRAGVLPPLQVKKEPTFHRQPKGNTTLSNPEEVRKHDDI